MRIGPGFTSILSFSLRFLTVFRARKNIISGIDTVPAARPGVRNGWLGIDTRTNRTGDYVNFEILWLFFNSILGFRGRGKGEGRKKIISGIDRACFAVPGIGNGWLAIDTCESDQGLSRLGFFWPFFSDILGFGRASGGEGLKK